MAHLTVRQSAAALGVSPKTIRRRIAEGDISASKELRGKQEVILIEGSELARYAESANLRLSLDTAVQDGAEHLLRTGHMGAIAPSGSIGDYGHGSRSAETAIDNGVPAEDLIGHIGTLENTLRYLRDALADCRQREAWLQDRVQAAEASADRERQRAWDERQRLLDLMPKALPPVRPWWQRMFERRRTDAG